MGLAKSFTALTGANVISMATQLVRGKVAALVLGPAGVGIFNQLSVLWNLFNVAAGLGSFVGVVTHGTDAIANKDGEALRRLSSTSLLLLGIVSCVLALAGVLMSGQISHWTLHDNGKHANLVCLILLSIPLAVAAQTYHALLAAARAIRVLAVAQIGTDIGAMFVFVVLIFPFGLRGAIAGFIATYVIGLAIKLLAVRRLLGSDVVWPRLARFSWPVVRSNVGFGLSTLITIALTNLAVLVVSRLLIQRVGIDANGIFANAWRIASVYLGSVTATGLAYLLPTLGRCGSDAELSREVDGALRFYLLILPLPMIAIMAGGELLIWLVLSRAFLPGAALLLLLVPAELMRIIRETVSLTLVARSKIVAYTVLSMVQPAAFVALALILIPRFGISGAAWAYLTGHLIALIANAIVCSSAFRLTFSASLQRLLVGSLVAVGSTGAAAFVLPFGPVRILVTLGIMAGWIAVVLIDPAARSLLRHRLAPLISRAAQ